MIKKFWKHRWVLRSILKSIYFNFHYLPFRQAIKLPILLYKPKFGDLKGKILLTKEAKFGLIKLGNLGVSLYPNNGIYIDNHGTIIFNGKCNIGNDSYISVGDSGCISFGDNVAASAALKITSYHRIELEDRVRIGWGCMFLDTDFHSMKKLGGGRTKGYGTIKLGENSWLGCKCLILKNTDIPKYTTVSAGTVLNKRLDIPEYSVVGMDNNIVVKSTGMYRDFRDDKINYSYDS